MQRHPFLKISVIGKSVRLFAPIILGSSMVIAGVISTSEPALATTSSPSPVAMGTASLG